MRTEGKVVTTRFQSDGRKRKAAVQVNGRNLWIGARMSPLWIKDEGRSSMVLGSVPVVKAIGDESGTCSGTSASPEKSKDGPPTTVGGIWASARVRAGVSGAIEMARRSFSVVEGGVGKEVEAV